MIKNCLHIVFFLFPVFTIQGQEYFSSVHIEEEYPETTSNVIVLEDGYATIGSVNEEGTRYINIRKFNIYGDLIDAIKHELVGVPRFGFAESFKQTNDGGYIWVGTDGIASVYRFDENFNLLWSKDYPDLLPFKWKSFEQAYEYENGDFLILGRTEAEIEDTDPHDTLIIKTDSEGNVIWHKVFGDVNDNDRLIDILPMNDGGFILVGAKYFPWDAYVVKIDSEGNKEWHKSYGGDFWDYLARGVKTQDGNIVIAFEDGKEHSNLISPDDSYDFSTLHLIKIDPEGNTIWDKEHSWMRNAYVFKVIETSNEDLVALGYQNYPQISEVGGSSFALRTNSEGDSLWFRHYSHSGFPEASWSEAYDIEQTDYGFVMAGVFRPTMLNDNYVQAQHTWIMHIDENGCVNTDCEYLDTEENISIEDEFSIYPNPASNTISIKTSVQTPTKITAFSLYDLTGRVIGHQSISNSHTIDVSHYPKGLYIIRLLNSNQEALASELLTIQ